jgi:Rod binding domain-containing protein
MKVPAAPTEGVLSVPRSVDELRGRNDPVAVKAAARELESVFAYQLIKAMRETTTTLSKNGLGADTYQSMFDMELARLFSERGIGLQEMMLKGLEKRAATPQDSNTGAAPKAVKALINERAGVPVSGLGKK